jgi:SAM-dependent methyltransferase
MLLDRMISEQVKKPAEQHLIEMRMNRDAWEKKALLRAIYQRFYLLIREQLATNTDAETVELGSGIGAIKAVIPECVTTDIFPNPWLDRVENAYALNFAEESIGNLILFDVFHHLEFPGTALTEFARVLRPAGRVVIFEPGLGVLGRFVYNAFHHEPVGEREPIRWLAPDGSDLRNAGYYAAQGNAWRLFVRNELGQPLDDWTIRTAKPIVSTAYLASGGFSKPSFYPDATLPLAIALDRLLSCLPRIFATRLLVVLERTETRAKSYGK